MEILNKNQRETAIWRLVSLGVIVLALIAVVLFSSYKAFESRGTGDIDDLARQLKECQMTAKGEKQRLQVIISDLEAQIKNLNETIKAKDPKKEFLDQKIELLETQIDGLKTELSICKQNNSKTN